MSDRIAVMDGGVVQQCGPPEEIYESPQKTFVAGFIGVSNLLPATVEGEGVRLQTGELFPSTIPDGCEQGASVYCSVRPEKIFLDDLEDGMVSMEGQIVERIYLGTTTQVIVELASDLRVVALEQNTARSAGRRPLGDRPTRPARMAPAARAGAPLTALHLPWGSADLGGHPAARSRGGLLLPGEAVG